MAGKQFTVMREQDAEQLLLAHAQRIAEVVGAPLERWTTVATPGEEPDGEPIAGGVWQLTGHARMPLPAAGQLAALHRLHDWWVALGNPVYEVNVYPDQVGGSVQATDRQDRVAMLVQSPQPPDWLALIVMSPCYLPAPDEEPYG